MTWKTKANIHFNIMVGMGIALFVGTAPRSIQANEKGDFLYIGDGGSFPDVEVVQPPQTR